MDLPDALTRAQRGDHHQVCRELTALLAEPGLDPRLRPALLSMLAAAWYYAGQPEHCIKTCDLACLAAADPGDRWYAYALTVRASALIEIGQQQRAADDLVEVEIALLDLPPGELTDRVRRSLVGSYAELEMFDRALERMPRTAPAIGQRIVDALNLCNLHLRRGRALERAGCDTDRAWLAEIKSAEAALAGIATDLATGPQTWAPIAAKMGLEVAALLHPDTGVPALADWIDAQRNGTPGSGGSPSGLSDNAVAVSLGVLVTALRRRGDLLEAGRRADQALAALAGPGIFAETEQSIRTAAVQTRLALGVPGSRAAAAYLGSAEAELETLRRERVEAFTRTLQHRLEAARLSRITALAEHDQLTGVGNRRALERWFRQHPAGPAVLAFVDLNRFKSINDTYGHTVGDLVLQRFAQALQSLVPADAVVVRFGGDEFVVARATTAGADPDSHPGAAPSPGSVDLALTLDADTLRDRLTAAVVDPPDDAGPEVRRAGWPKLSASIGTVRIGPGASTREALLHADQHLYQNKRTAG